MVFLPSGNTSSFPHRTPPSFPRRRESITSNGVDRAAPPARLDSRLRGNDGWGEQVPTTPSSRRTPGSMRAGGRWCALPRRHRVHGYRRPPG
ncbi:hypothetical protein DC429_07235 [Arthrobacter sp. TPD3018]|nr:hypothetical protein DC425_07225 [Sphingomonas sp. TPD3009]PVE61648.1 hypothetical protein DC429_07235 [Arthrobacter sp. TPD3018]PVE85434.1 hypothetical protein DC431_05950 [Sphingomonas melonis]